MTQPKTIPVPVAVVDGVLQYLATRPFKEVHQGIAALSEAIQQAQQAEEAEDKPLSPAERRAVNGVLAKAGDEE